MSPSPLLKFLAGQKIFAPPFGFVGALLIIGANYLTLKRIENKSEAQSKSFANKSAQVAEGFREVEGLSKVVKEG